MSLGPSLTLACDDGGAAGADRVTAKLTNPDGLATTNLELSLMWVNSATSPDVAGLTATRPIAGTLPQSVALALGDAPPARLLNDYTKGGVRPRESRIGIAYIAALPKGYDLAAEDPPAVSGASPSFVVAWVDSDIQPKSFSAALVGGTLKRGFHLLQVTPAAAYDAAHPELAACEELETDCELPADLNDTTAMKAYFACDDAARSEAGCLQPPRGFDRLSPAPQGLDTPIEIRLDDGDFDAPNWT